MRGSDSCPPDLIPCTQPPTLSACGTCTSQLLPDLVETPSPCVPMAQHPLCAVLGTLFFHWFPALQTPSVVCISRVFLLPRVPRIARYPGMCRPASAGPRPGSPHQVPISWPQPPRVVSLRLSKHLHPHRSLLQLLSLPSRTTPFLGLELISRCSPAPTSQEAPCRDQSFEVTDPQPSPGEVL